MVASLLLMLAAQSDTLGKTDAQILAMGRSKWYGFYSGKTGEGPAAFASSQYVYARALGRRSDRILRSRSSADRRRILALRKETGTFAEAMTAVDAADGTLDELSSSDRAIEVEELIERLARRSWAGIPARRLSDVAVALSSRRPGATESARGALVQARASLQRIAQTLKGSPRRESDAVLEFLQSLVVVADRP